MNNLSEYIIEKLKINKDSRIFHPKTKEELTKLLNKLVRERGENANLNDIDTSEITDMSYLFSKSLAKKIHNIDISDWDTSNVTDMSLMFSRCHKFNCDISKWDVSNCRLFNRMFYGCWEFNQNLDNWKVRDYINGQPVIVSQMFNACKALKNTPEWYDKLK